MNKMFCKKCSKCRHSYSYPCDNEYNQNGYGIEYDWECLIKSKVLGLKLDDNYTGENEIDYQGCYYIDYFKSFFKKGEIK